MLRAGAITILLLTGLQPVAAVAEPVVSDARSELFARQTRVLDGRAAQQYARSIRLQPNEVIVPGTPGAAAPFAQPYRGVWLSEAMAAARRYGIPEQLFLRLVQQESGWNPRARSVKGALGLAQLMPATARKLGVDPFDPRQNLDGGARYLAEQYRRFRSWRLALAAYNAGPEAVQKYGGVPPYRETQGYVRAILGQ